ncbi:hypothetical protein [Streptomyces resistomycificus]|nr:hypothetical protein [Streptomyces resistomycificus]
METHGFEHADERRQRNPSGDSRGTTPSWTASSEEWSPVEWFGARPR